MRRATYWCPEMKADDPAKKGVCSNFLCDSKPGDEIKLTGPSGKVMLMPEDDPNMTYIMVATGTGIAPFRSFLRRLFGEATPAGKNFKGLAWLFLGVANKDALLYDEEFQVLQTNNPHETSATTLNKPFLLDIIDQLHVCPYGARGLARPWCERSSSATSPTSSNQTCVALTKNHCMQVYLRQNPDKMRMDYALSREGPLNKKGGKMYIQVPEGATNGSIYLLH